MAISPGANRSTTGTQFRSLLQLIGLGLHYTGRYVEAEKCLLQALQTKPNNQLHLEELQEIKEKLFRVEIPFPPGPPLSESKLSNNGKLFNPQYRHARYWGLLCLQYER